MINVNRALLNAGTDMRWLINEAIAVSLELPRLIDRSIDRSARCRAHSNHRTTEDLRSAY